VGAAVSLAAAELALAASYGLALKRSDPALMHRLAAAPRILIGAGLALTVPLVFGLSDVAAILVGTALYAVALVTLRAIPSELKDALLGRAHGLSE
jgi:hypothetical protein